MVRMQNNPNYRHNSDALEESVAQVKKKEVGGCRVNGRRGVQ
jgi:hypothetical protein